MKKSKEDRRNKKIEKRQKRLERKKERKERRAQRRREEPNSFKRTFKILKEKGRNTRNDLIFWLTSPVRNKMIEIYKEEYNKEPDLSDRRKFIEEFLMIVKNRKKKRKEDKKRKRIERRENRKRRKSKSYDNMSLDLYFNLEPATTTAAVGATAGSAAVIASALALTKEIVQLIREKSKDFEKSDISEVEKNISNFSNLNNERLKIYERLIKDENLRKQFESEFRDFIR